MGILSSLSIDIEELVQLGYTDEYIAKAVDEELPVIQFIINYFREQKNSEQPLKIKIKSKTKRG